MRVPTRAPDSNEITTIQEMTGVAGNCSTTHEEASQHVTRDTPISALVSGPWYLLSKLSYVSYAVVAQFANAVGLADRPSALRPSLRGSRFTPGHTSIARVANIFFFFQAEDGI